MTDNTNYSYISTIITPDGTTHYIKDSEARTAITALENSFAGLGSVMHFKGSVANETALYAVKSADLGDVYITTDTGKEYVCKTAFTEAVWNGLNANQRKLNWEMLGYTIDLTPFAKTADLGDLAFKDGGSVTFIPGGSVGTPTITVTPNTGTVNSITDVGTLPTHAADTFTQGSFTSGTFSKGTLPTWSASVANETLSFSFTQGSLPSHGADTFVKPTFTQGTFTQGSLPTKGNDTTVVTGIKSATSTKPTFGGTQQTVNVSFS